MIRSSMGCDYLLELRHLWWIVVWICFFNDCGGLQRILLDLRGITVRLEDLAFGGSGQISPDYRICTALLYEDLNGFMCIWINSFFRRRI